MPYAVCVPTWRRWLKKHLWITWYVSYDTLGDFNFRINEPADVHAAKFQGFDWAIQFDSLVNLSTHVAGNTLDLILTCDDVSVTRIHTDHSVNSDHCAVLFIYHVFPVVLSENLLITVNGNRLISHLSNLIYLGLSLIFPLMISALLLDFIMIPLRIVLKNTHPKNHGLWLSEQTNLCIRRNFRLKNGCGVNVKGNIKTPKLVSDKLLFKEQRNKYNNLLNSTKKDYIKNRIEKMRNPRKIYIRYVINC